MNDFIHFDNLLAHTNVNVPINTYLIASLYLVCAAGHHSAAWLFIIEIAAGRTSFEQDRSTSKIYSQQRTKCDCGLCQSDRPGQGTTLCNTAYFALQASKSLVTFLL